MPGERAQTAVSGWTAQTAVAEETAQTNLAGWTAETAVAGERAQTNLAGWRAHTAMTDHEMYGVGHKLHHFVDMRDFPENKHAQYNAMSLQNPKHIPFSVEREN